MLKKRLLGVITVLNGWAVQSFGYRDYLPLGKPEVLAENLDRWGADEILLQCIDRSRANLGPDFPLLERIGKLGLSTPLIYCGGIRSVEEGVRVVKAGADRICIDALLHEHADMASRLSEPLGAQAIIAALPLSFEEKGLAWLDYRNGRVKPVPQALLDLLASGAISEALVIDWRNEGRAGGFDGRLIDRFVAELPLIAFGGLSETPQLRALLEQRQIAAVAIGNFLNYGEHAVQRYKEALAELPLRTAYYEPMSAAS